MSTTPLIIIAIGIISYLLTCWALFDVANREFGTIGKKAAWGIVAFIPFAGWLIYLVLGRRKGKAQPVPPKTS